MSVVTKALLEVMTVLCGGEATFNLYKMEVEV